MKNAFMAKQFLYESTFLVIMDPTSLAMKNVTPYCSQIFEVLELFKGVYAKLIELKEEGLMQLGIDPVSGNGQDYSISEIDSVIEDILRKNLDEHETILNKLFRMVNVKNCSQSLDE